MAGPLGRSELTPKSEVGLSAGAGTKGVLSGGERLVVLTVTLATMLAPLNSTMIAVAMPDIMRHFDAGIATAGWLITAYLVAMASLMPLAGKIGDRFGRRRFVLGGLALFGLASLAAAAAPNLSLLLLFRVLQAVAGALIVPNGAALLRLAVPELRRGRSFGLLGAGVGLAAGLGPPIGGAKSGINFGINKDDYGVEGSEIEVDWQPGGCILHKRENLILDGYFPFSGKAYSEDLMHSFLLRSAGVRLFTCLDSYCYINADEGLDSLFHDFRARYHFVKMASLSKSRMILFYIFYIWH